MSNQKANTMERCSIFDNVTVNTTGSMETWQEPEEDQKSWDLRLEIKIMALFLYLFLFTFVEFLFNKQINVNKDLTEQTDAKNGDHDSVKDAGKSTGPSLEEPEMMIAETEEEKMVTVDAPSVKSVAAPVKRKNNTTQRKKEAPKRHLATTDLTNVEPVAKKKYQELQIIIDFQ